MKCESCKGKGWITYPFDGADDDLIEVERCDTCQKFGGDLEAATAFFKSTKRYCLDHVIARRTKVIIKRQAVSIEVPAL